LDLGTPEYIARMEKRFLEYAVKRPGIRELDLRLLQSRRTEVLDFALADEEILFPL